MGSKELFPFIIWLSNHDFWIPHPRKRAWVRLWGKRIIFSFTDPDFLKQLDSKIEGQETQTCCFWTNFLCLEKWVALFQYSWNCRFFWLLSQISCGVHEKKIWAGGVRAGWYGMECLCWKLCDKDFRLRNLQWSENNPY